MTRLSALLASPVMVGCVARADSILAKTSVEPDPWASKTPLRPGACYVLKALPDCKPSWLAFFKYEDPGKGCLGTVEVPCPGGASGERARSLRKVSP